MAQNKKQKKHLVEATGPEVTDDVRGLLESRTQKYLLVNVLARRARDLNKGSQLLVPRPEGATLTEVAIIEAMGGKLDLKRRSKSQVLVSMISNE